MNNSEAIEYNVIQLYKQGLRPDAIALKLAVSEEEVLKHLGKPVVDKQMIQKSSSGLRSSGRPRMYDEAYVNQIKEEYMDGASLMELAERYQPSYPTLQRWSRSWCKKK